MFTSIKNFGHVTIEKHLINVRYRIKSDSTHAKNGKLVIEYKEDEPKVIADTSEW